MPLVTNIRVFFQWKPNHAIAVQLDSGPDRCTWKTFLCIWGTCTQHLAQPPHAGTPPLRPGGAWGTERAQASECFLGCWLIHFFHINLKCYGTSSDSKRLLTKDWLFAYCTQFGFMENFQRYQRHLKLSSEFHKTYLKKNQVLAKDFIPSIKWRELGNQCFGPGKNT